MFCDQVSLGSGSSGGGGGEYSSGAVLQPVLETPAPAPSSGHYAAATVTAAESEAPPPLPPRFATIRKSYTLPHNMAGAGAGAGAGAEQGRIYDNPAHLRRDTAAPATQGQGSLPKRAGQQLLRPRPSSLSVEKRQFLRSVSQDNSNPR